jgi:lipopolysaccharide heptosyltransferase I
MAPVSDLVLNPLSVPPAARRILVIRLGALGDVVRTMPAVALLRDAYPDAHIDWLVEERTEAVVAGRGYLDGVVVFPRAGLVEQARSLHVPAVWAGLRRFLRALRAKDYDLVLDFHAIARSATLARLARASLRIGYAPPYAREGAHHLVDRRVRLARAKCSRFTRNEALVRAVIGEAPQPKTPALVPVAAARDALRGRLAGEPAPVVLHPGSSLVAAHKRWPSERFADLARALEARGYRPVIASGPSVEEQRLATGVCAESGLAHERLIVTQTFEELAALLEASQAFVGCDSGPLHVSSLVGTPVVQLVGPTDPDENEPWSETPSRRVSIPLACRPCRRGCAAAACMRGIEVESVVEALSGLVDGRGRLRVVPMAAR